ncbi:MAG TPA: DUF402 domain-containing protein [Dehalococcoidia bacterium]|nr:DUF402 domain-containing protein [Dehalococcoidia bacterium]
MPRTDLIGLTTPVHVTKYDGSYHRRLPTRYVQRKQMLHLLALAAGTPVCRTPEPVDDPAPPLLQWSADLYLWEDRWYTVQRARRPEGPRYYVDIATPAEFDGAAFHLVDLDLDVMWDPGSEPEVWDEDEFLDHSRAMRYPAPVIEHARSAVDEVLGLIRERAFPFDRA